MTKTHVRFPFLAPAHVYLVGMVGLEFTTFRIYSTLNDVNSSSGGSNTSQLLFAGYGRNGTTTYNNLWCEGAEASYGSFYDSSVFTCSEDTLTAKESFTATLRVHAFQQWGNDSKNNKVSARVLQNGTQIAIATSSSTNSATGAYVTIEMSVRLGDTLQFQRKKNSSDGGSAGGLFFIYK